MTTQEFHTQIKNEVSPENQEVVHISKEATTATMFQVCAMDAKFSPETSKIKLDVMSYVMSVLRSLRGRTIKDAVYSENEDEPNLGQFKIELEPITSDCIESSAVETF